MLGDAWETEYIYILKMMNKYDQKHRDECRRMELDLICKTFSTVRYENGREQNINKEHEKQIKKCPQSRILIAPEQDEHKHQRSASTSHIFSTQIADLCWCFPNHTTSTSERNIFRTFRSRR